MPRIKRGTIAKKKHRKLKKLTKGYLHSRRASVKKAREAVFKAGLHTYRDNRRKKRDFRRLWIVRISAGLQKHNLKYSQLINLLQKKKVGLNRKILAELAKDHPEIFDKLIEKIKEKGSEEKVESRK